MRVPVRLLPLAALASWEAFRIAACVLAGRAARQSRRRWEGDAAMKNTSAETAGGGVSLRAVAEGSPRTRASLDLVRPPEKPEVRAWRDPAATPSTSHPRLLSRSSDTCVRDN